MQHREASQLRKKYDNVKKELRKQRSAERRDAMTTGGGASDLQPWHPKSDAIAELARNIAITADGMDATFDDDDFTTQTATGDLNDANILFTDGTLIDDSMLSEHEETIDLNETLKTYTKQNAGTAGGRDDGSMTPPASTSGIDNTSTSGSNTIHGLAAGKQHDWSKYNVGMLKTPISAPLKRSADVSASKRARLDANVCFWICLCV